MERRTVLVDLGAEVLADTLLSLALWNREVDDTIERLVSTPAEAVARFQHRLANLGCMDEFIDWRRLGAFVHEIEFLLAELKAGVTNSRTGFELVVSFFQSDKDIFENCDDDGAVGAVFQNGAVELLGYFGAGCDDKDWMCDQLMRLFEQDSFGVRSDVFDSAAQYLPEGKIRLLIARLQNKLKHEPKDFEKRRWSSAIESLARQLKDPEIFEQSRRWGRQTLSSEDICDIARMWFEAGDAQTALELIQDIDAARFRSHDYHKLLLAIHEKLGNAGEQSTLAWRMFREHRCQESLSALIQIIGEEQRKLVIEKQSQEILATKQLSYTDAKFLIDFGLLNEAEKYLWDHVTQLRGGFYSSILPLAEEMENNDRFLIATVLYRALVDAILARAYAKAYHYGVAYLRKLHAMAKPIRDWRNIVPHAGYLQELRISHGRKGSFWSGYEHQ